MHVSSDGRDLSCTVSVFDFAFGPVMISDGQEDSLSNYAALICRIECERLVIKTYKCF